jgi:hypothetical protein
VLDEAESLITVIRDAFEGVEPPSILAHCDQCELWVESFADLHIATWGSLPDSAIAREYAALNSVTPAAWRFLAPAYMTWYIRNSQSSDSNTAEHLIYQLGGDPKDEHIKQGHKTLSKTQRAAVRAFLEFVRPRLEASGDTYLADFARRGIAYWSEAAV